MLSLQVFGDGADGCQPVPGDSDGAGPRAAFLPALPDAVRDQTSACSWHHSQGEILKRASERCHTVGDDVKQQSRGRSTVAPANGAAVTVSTISRCWANTQRVKGQRPLLWSMLKL